VFVESWEKYCFALGSSWQKEGYHYQKNKMVGMNIIDLLKSFEKRGSVTPKKNGR